MTDRIGAPETRLHSEAEGLFYFLWSPSWPAYKPFMAKYALGCLGIIVIVFLLLLVGYLQGWIEPQHVR